MTVNKINVPVKKLHEDAIIPQYQSEGAAGFDIHALIDNNGAIVVLPNERKLIRTGLAFAIPVGYELQLRPRSGLALNYGITLTNSPGTVDADFRGEVKVILHNTGDKQFIINHGDRIAQGVFAEVTQGEFNEVEELDKTERGSGGFGSTGKV